MYQLRNLIHRTNVPGDPQNNMNAAEDFLLLLLHAHVVSAAETLQKQHPETEVKELARVIVEKFVRLPRAEDEIKSCTDGVNMYAVELLTLSLLWHGFHDSIKEGDGDRLFRYWKFLIVVFKSTNHRNYAKEAVNVLFQSSTTTYSQTDKRNNYYGAGLSTRRAFLVGTSHVICTWST